ncbi:hypothetical protein FH972_023837 [Carpinus fangiana]|uniref:PHD-type domain-containing protein n=1 Tax=Carpinus fangiana TaxID=176857 RepID=A0A5N6KWC9_9ROSI|nr:hypothetical protein FH972_023837 [Carpinus fangiana]
MASAAAHRSSRSAGQASPIQYYNSDSPRKRQKYVPGGIGGGGRWDESEEPVRTPVSRSRPRPRGRPPTRRRNRPSTTPAIQGSTAAEAAAAAQVDGYKPREERSWEEFHPDLDLEVPIAVFSADEVDGIDDAASRPSSAHGSPMLNGHSSSLAHAALSTPQRRRPGRPPGTSQTMLAGLGSPPAPRITPLPSHNPKERLNLPKPSHREIKPFAAFDEDGEQSLQYVDKGMANVGYQETEVFNPPEHFIRMPDSTPGDGLEHGLVLEADKESESEAVRPSRITRVEYDMDEQDTRWLEDHNMTRKGDVEEIKPAIFEIAMTQIEKEWHALEKRIPKPNPKPPQTHRPRSSSAAAVNGEAPAAGEEQDSKCAICDDGDCENTNAIVFCDGCDLAVHQECYGVPFIPEGQWLCRKCQSIGRGVPTCIFCPNTEGAFKLTTQQRWAHLLCAIWIPEVSLANTSLMEPIDGVEKVPKPRWKLNCYICNQKMGACIQCSNRTCFQAFHVTCARRAKLYLKMKNPQGGGIASLDASVLKAYCDKHVPTEWEREHGSLRAAYDAKVYYRKAMKGRKWADSQLSALAMVHQPIETNQADGEAGGESQISTAAQKRKILEAQKSIWRLPSGAPVVPQVVYDAVVESLARFSVRKRKEFAAEACKYWTLKREARRGAALLKRLQLQMETFSASEITRRDFVAMGPAGRGRLQRRIDFAEQLLRDLAQIRALCEQVKEREAHKLQNAELLREMLDTVYFPVQSLLSPIIDKLITMDKDVHFWEEFRLIKARVDTRAYTSVAAFTADVSHAFQTSVPYLGEFKDVFEMHAELSSKSLREVIMEPDSKNKLKEAKRFLNTINDRLQEATQHETDLAGKQFDGEIQHIQNMVNGGDHKSEKLEKSRVNGLHNIRDGPVTPPEGANGAATSSTSGDVEMADVPTVNGGDVAGHSTAPLTPPRSEKNLLATNSVGGVPWYLELFDIAGTTVHDERWTGREVMRDMSEELSEIGEDELTEMGVGMNGVKDEAGQSPGPPASPKAVKKRRAARFSSRRR